MEDNFAHKAQEWDSPEKMKRTGNFVAEMKKYITPDKSWKALEVGAGTGLVGLEVLPEIDAVVFEDTSESMLGVLKNKLNGTENVEIVHGEVFDYQKNDIDWIFSCMAFHHLPDIPKVLDHLAGITKKGAKVAVCDLLTEDGSFHNFEPIPHKGFDADQLKQQFRNAGFTTDLLKVYNAIRKPQPDGSVKDYQQFILIATRN